jgi:hypothetical protein
MASKGDKKMIRVTILFLVILFLPTLTYADHQFELGQKFEGIIPLHIENGNDQQIALPAGEWIVTATSGFDAQRAASGSSQAASGTKLANVYLANIVGGKLKAAIRFRYTRVNRSSGWSVPKYCQRDNLNYQKVAAAYDGTQTDCWGVSYIRGASKPGTPGARSAEYVNKLGVKIPIVLVYAEYDMANYSDFLIVGYALNPEFEGISPPENMGSFRAVDYHPSRIGNYPQKKAYMEKIIEWGKSWKSKVEMGFKGKLTANVAPNPEPNVETKTRNTGLEKKLQDIKNLENKGLITKDEAAKKRQEILNSM